MREPRIVEARRAVDAVEAGFRRGAVGLRRERPGDVAGAHAQLEHDRSMARLGKLEPLLDHAHDGRQVGTRVEQPHRGLHRIGIGALLDHARALAVILAQNDHRAADHAGRRQVRQGVCRHVRPDDRLPGDGAAQRIVDRGTQHGGGGGLVGAGFQMHAELGHHVLGVDQHVEQVRHRRALVAAHIGDPGLQQRLGDRQNALAAENLPVAELQRLHFLRKRTFRHSRFLEPIVAGTLAEFKAGFAPLRAFAGRKTGALNPPAPRAGMRRRARRPRDRIDGDAGADPRVGCGESRRRRGKPAQVKGFATAVRAVTLRSSSKKETGGSP